jgi:hypothetical protein
MRRDWNIIRWILLDIDRGDHHLPRCERYDAEAVAYHVRLCAEGELLELILYQGETFAVVPTLTSKGRDFVDTVRDGYLWVGVMIEVEGMGGAPYQVLLDMCRDAKYRPEDE